MSKLPLKTVSQAKQIHCFEGEVEAVPQGVDFAVIPKNARVYAVYVENKSQLPKSFYGGGTFSLGVNGNPDWYCEKMDISGGSLLQAKLGPGAGRQGAETVARAYWHFSGQGNPTSGRISVLILFALP